MMNRRLFLGTSIFGAGVPNLLFHGLTNRAEKLSANVDLSGWKAAGYGELFPVRAKNTGEIFVELPRGFEYNAIGKVDGIMSDGNKTPSAHDGMAAFKLRKEIRLVRNHEVSNGQKPIPGSAIGANPYDESAGGGTTTLIIDPKTREMVRDFTSLSGTLVNCAGGATPWGSWISCEETTLGKTVREDGNGGFLKPHGYCFEVFASSNSSTSSGPIKEMGRFVHEAIAVDRKSGVIYLTEDTSTSGFYRFVPNRNKRLAEGGKLQILAVKDMPNYNTAKGQKAGTKLNVTWLTIDNPDPEDADVDEKAVFKQGAAKGAASFSRLEGCFPVRGGGTYFVATSGGDAIAGQIWLYKPDGRDGGVLTLVFESPGIDLLDMPDNICLRPGSPNLFICEDGDYSRQNGNSENFIRILSPEGKIANLAKNITPDKSKSEFAGGVFSPDGKTLFVNIQGAGTTLAIWGDWDRFKN